MINRRLTSNSVNVLVMGEAMPNPRLPIRIGYWIVAILFLSCHALTAAESPRALPADWWKSMTPEEIWKQSESATMGLNFYRGFKPQLKTDSNRSLEFLQRKRTDDSLELKWIRHSLKDSSWFAWCKTKEGRWFQADGGVAARMDMPDTEDDEIKYAKSMAEPYRYKVLEHTMIGAHDCVVISRTLSPPMFQVMRRAPKVTVTQGRDTLCQKGCYPKAFKRDTLLRARKRVKTSRGASCEP
jgi:hypothetical protein